MFDRQVSNKKHTSLIDLERQNIRYLRSDFEVTAVVRTVNGSSYVIL